MTRKHYLDNIRWATVLVVMLYHVVYFFNNKGVFGGIGGFSDNPQGQPQDVLMYLVYPWFMMLLFVVAGMSSRYALTSGKGGFVRTRTRKLLVPATIGLLVFQWMTGYFNCQIGGEAQGIHNQIATLPAPARYPACVLGGIGPLWFVQDLWFYSLLIFIIYKVDKQGRLYNRLAHLGEGWKVWPTLAVGLLLTHLGSQAMIAHPNPQSLEGLLNLYRPVTYLVMFLMGYFVFSHEAIIDRLKRTAWIWMGAAVALAVVYVMAYWGQTNTDPSVLMSPLTSLYAWVSILAMLGGFKAWANKTSPLAAYLSRNSYGYYVLHYLVLASVGYMLKVYTQLPPVADYLLLLLAVFGITPLLNELISRIPFLRWCVLGIKKEKKIISCNSTK